jgi:hypothetical protein
MTVWDEDSRVADERLLLVEKTIQGRDFTCMRETVNAIKAWLGSLPGHIYANVRQPPISTLNLAHMMPFSAVWAGPERDEHLETPPLFFARTEGSTPFRFSLHVGDVGHTLVVGPTGAGKSVLLALMALQFRRYEGAQVFAFDFGGSIRAAAARLRRWTPGVHRVPARHRPGRNAAALCDRPCRRRRARNYRVQGNHMIVDRLFAAAELRLGGKEQQVVRIVRTDGRPQS